MQRIFSLLATLALLAAGCHAQIPAASSYVVDLTWTAPTAQGQWAGCTVAAPCVYAVYRAPQSSGACPVSTSTQWVEVTTAATRPSGTAFSDATATGQVCYAVVTFQGTANSGASNTALATIPGTPLAPTLGTPSLVADALPAPNQQLALIETGNLRIRVRR